MAVGRMLRGVVADRAKGKRPSPVRSIFASAAAAVAAGAVTYRVLRR